MPGIVSEGSRRETYYDAPEALTFTKRQEYKEHEGVQERTGRLSHQHSFDGSFGDKEQILASGGQDGKRKLARGYFGGTKFGDGVEDDPSLIFFRGGGGDRTSARDIKDARASERNHDPEILSNGRYEDRSLRLRSSGLRNPGIFYSNLNGNTVHPAEVDEERRPKFEHKPPNEIVEEGDAEGVVNTADSVDRKTMEEIYASFQPGQEQEIQEVVEPASEFEEVPVDVTGEPKSPSNGQHLDDHFGAPKHQMETDVMPGRHVSSKPPLGPSASSLSRNASVEARNRWRRVRFKMALANPMSISRRSGSDFLEDGGPLEIPEDEYTERTDGGRAGAAAFEGARIRGRFRAKGRRGMEGMMVRQDKGFVTLVQDFYVACLKMPMTHFVLGVFCTPICLALMFTPLYLFDKGGLAFDGVTLAEDEVVIVSRVAAARQKASALLQVFLYALSLSTTFGGSPVNAMSPLCLVIANVNTLMGQFLFVFLSGAVFARMSQPSHPVRCSKKAIIKADDFSSVSMEDKEKFKVFAVRLVLTGPPPCELVDAKICLTFRIFIKLPSGSMFCSTQDLELVRPEVSYLRYGIMVRHVIDKKSPVYGHTMESLKDGDASFSLTIMGLERTSMQPIFHLEDYFVCDDDVAWDCEYEDFIRINEEGHRVLDHSKIDLITSTKDQKLAGIEKITGESSSDKKDEGKSSLPESPKVVKGWAASALRGRKVWSSKSTSFTRADW